jgi:6-pyruvoyltetrahydropterin/6-carboxytetrahydropterin synthase
MYRVTKRLTFCYGHRLMDYDGKCRVPHGHNGAVEIELESDRLDHRGMVYDFSEIKSAVKEWLDRELDHRMLLRKDDPLAPLLRGLGEPLVVMEENPTAEAIARLIYEFAESRGFPLTQVRLWETETSYATYERPRGAGAG